MSFVNTNSSMQYLAAQAKPVERAYVWCLMAWWARIERNDIRINPQELYDPSVSMVLSAIIELYEDGVTPDLVSIAQKLTDKWQFYPNPNGINNQYLVELVSWDFVYDNLRKYESMVKENALKMATQRVVDRIANDTERSAANILKYWQELIELSTTWMGNWARWFDMKYAHSLADKISELDGKELYGYSFGSEFNFLDFATKWVQKGKTYRIGAPSNTGKTQFAYSVINNLLAQWARVMFFTLENEVQTTLGYLMSNKQRESIDNIMRWQASADFDYLSSISDKLSIVDTSFYLTDIFTRIMEFKPDVVILDYIWLMSIKGFTEEAKYTEYAIQVQRFVKQVQVAWIDLSNLPTQLQASEDIRGNPQFYGSTFLRNNTDVGIHIMPWKQFYEMRDKVLSDDIYDINTKNSLKRLSGVGMYLSKNRLWPHSISGNYIIDFTKWAEFTECSSDQFKSLASKYGL